MGKVKSAFEKAMEKASEIGELTPEEKEEIKDQEKIKSILTEFYKGQIDRDGLWQKLKGNKPSLLKKAQQYLIDSFGLGSTPEEFQQRKEGILAVETLKAKQNVSAIEQMLNSVKVLQKEYQDGKDKAEEELREAIEQNPQLRLRPVRTPDGRTVLQAAYSVDEALQARLSEFMSQHEEKYSQKFVRLIEKLKKEVSR
jgi:arsenate reductase-like glutaredoxin family protein